MKTHKLIAFAALAVALLPVSVQAFDNTAKTVEWCAYSNGISPGYGGTFKPDKGYTYIHVDDIDVALNGPLASGEAVYLMFTATYEDGTIASSGGTAYMDKPQLFEILPKVYWSLTTLNGKRMKSLSYQVFDANGPPSGSTATAIISATGTETSIAR